MRYGYNTPQYQQPQYQAAVPQYQAPINNNPLMGLLQMAQTGGNPQAIALQYLQKQAASNPEANRMYQMLQNKTPQEFNKITQNLLNNSGNQNAKTLFNTIRQQYGL